MRTLESLIENLKRIDSNQSNEMAQIAEAQLIGKFENDKERASQKMKDVIDAFPNSPYPVQALCDLALRNRDSELLDFALEKQHTTNKTYEAYSKAMKGDRESALAIIDQELAKFPEETRERAKTRVEELLSSR